MRREIWECDECGSELDEPATLQSQEPRFVFLYAGRDGPGLELCSGCTQAVFDALPKSVKRMEEIVADASS